MLLNANNQYSKTKLLARKNKRSTLKKVVLASTIFIGFQFSTTKTLANETEGFETIYHVYLDNDYVGLLSDEEKLEKLKEEKIAGASEQFGDLALAVTEDLSVIPERVFSMKTNDQVVMEKLETDLAVETEAIGFQIGEEVVLYVKDQADYDAVLRGFQLQYVAEEELVAYEATGEAFPELQEGETRIAQLLFSEEPAATKGKVDPSTVLTVAEAIEVLNNGNLVESQYAIESGDVLETIAKKHGMTKAQLMEINAGVTEETVLQIGEELTVTIAQPYVALEAHYETKTRTNIEFENVTEEDETIDKGETTITQEGQYGEKLLTEYIRKSNGNIIETTVMEEQVLSEPVNEITVVGTKETPSKGTGTLQWPTVGGYVSSPMGSRWGRQHRGIDIARPTDLSILAADNGVVVATGVDGSYGNKVVIDHQNGYRTLYAHLEVIDVQPGQVVAAGSKIGVMGTTGRSTGIHLHFEVTQDGTLLNPLSMLQ